MKTDEKKFQEAFKKYKDNFTEDVTPPECRDCNKSAEVYDQSAGENFCYRHLEDDLRSDPNALYELVDFALDKKEAQNDTTK
jgi:hypothetical protein